VSTQETRRVHRLQHTEVDLDNVSTNDPYLYDAIVENTRRYVGLLAEVVSSSADILYADD